MRCAVSRQRYRLGWRACKVDRRQQHLQRHLVLQVAAGHTDRQHRTVVFQHDRRSQRDPRAFARQNFVRMAGFHRQAAKARAKLHTRVARGGSSPTTRSRGDHIAEPVGHQACRRVPLRSTSARRRLRRRGLERTCGERIARTQLARRPAAVDQRPPRLRVGRRQQFAKRHIRKQGVAIVRVAVRQRQLQRLHR